MSDDSRGGLRPGAGGFPEVTREAGQLASLVGALCDAGGGMRVTKDDCPNRQPFPSRDAVVSIVESLRTALFPGYFGPSHLTPATMPFYVGSTLDEVQRALREQVRRGFCFTCRERHPECEARTESTVQGFLDRLPIMRRLLATDVQAAYEGDPAATSPDETVFCYPGVLAVINYRLAHELYELGLPLIPRIMTEHAHSLTGIDIHPGAKIGESFFIDHGTGVVIGETSVIGNRVRLYQGVTLGAKSFALDESGNPVKGVERHPIVEDDVIIYSGATILGRVTIGRGSIIGGNVWLTRSVPPATVVTQAQVRQDLFESGAGI